VQTFRLDLIVFILSSHLFDYQAHYEASRAQCSQLLADL
jgi:hypothetical protein